MVVWFELDEFERPGAYRMTAHVARRHMARINGRHSGCEQHQKCRLRAPQHEADIVIAIGDDLCEVAIPCFAGIKTELLVRFA